ncbi:MAG TPA: hypothetical protein VH061_10995 [Solirubrobacteraceae bacterium]|jgi:hypothetical protein|nr:hypothetical protein [Solirubrobacteraceae bacterium]
MSRRLAGCALVCVFGALGLAPAVLAATPGDIAATKALREAELRREQALLKVAPAADKAAGAYVTAVQRECPGVLHGAPEPSAGRLSFPGPRKRGELERSESQLSSIEQEADGGLLAAVESLFVPAVDTFQTEITKLTWSDPRIREALDSETSLSGSTPPVSSASLCTDLRAWAASGFQTLAPGTKAYTSGLEKSLGEPTGVFGSAELLRSSESPASQRLEKEIGRVDLRLRSSLAPFGRDSGRLKRALGEPHSLFEQRKSEPVLARGRTHSGEKLVIKRLGQGGLFGACKHQVSVEFDSEKHHGGAIESSGDSEEICISRRGARRPTISCGKGNELLAMAMPAQVRSVRLRLSSGREIVAPTVRIAARADGGPASVYAESLRGYEPRPVMLTELDAAGTDVRSVRIEGDVRCRPQPKIVGPTFVPLVHATTPSGEPFVIEGSLVRFGRHSSFSVSLSFPKQETDLGIGGGFSISSSSSITIGGKPRAFEQQLSAGCPPRDSWVIYGLLATPGSTIEVRTAAGLTQLTQVPIAAAYRSVGPLEYGAFASPPLEVIVRRVDGTTIYTEGPVKEVVEEREYCEGLAEPSS